MFDFWRKLLISIGALTVASGLAFAFLQDFFAVRLITEPVAVQVAGTVSAAQGPLASLYLGVVGAVTVFMGIVVMAIGLGPLERRDPWALPALEISLIGWYAVDSAVAAVHGATALLVFNTAVLAAFAVPLIGLWHALRGAKRPAVT